MSPGSKGASGFLQILLAVVLIVFVALFIRQSSISGDAFFSMVGTDFRIEDLESNKSSINPGEHNIANYGVLMLRLANTGDESLNTSKLMM
ncbi:MAG: hypothetical protein ABEJ36_02080 [Candidatus Nanosalina sp.]